MLAPEAICERCSTPMRAEDVEPACERCGLDGCCADCMAVHPCKDPDRGEDFADAA